MLFRLIFYLLAIIAIGLAVLVALRVWDSRADQNLHKKLERLSTSAVPRFEEQMVFDLPEPAARFFRFAILPGTELKSVAVIRMGGELSLGSRQDPNYQPMEADQILAPPHGLLWQVRLEGASHVTGSDAYTSENSWSRFRLLNLIPVGRVSHDADHMRSAFGRLVGEGLFWTPAAFLPAANAGWDHLEWEIVDQDTAAVIVRHEGLEQRAEVTVGKNGQPLRVVFQRWSNENEDRIFRLQPFGGDLTEFRNFDGFNLPTRVIGGNFYGTDLYHPFFKAEVGSISFP